MPEAANLDRLRASAQPQADHHNELRAHNLPAYAADCQIFEEIHTRPAEPSTRYLIIEHSAQQLIHQVKRDLLFNAQQVDESLTPLSLRASDQQASSSTRADVQPSSAPAFARAASFSTGASASTSSSSTTAASASKQRSQKPAHRLLHMTAELWDKLPHALRTTLSMLVDENFPYAVRHPRQKHFVQKWANEPDDHPHKILLRGALLRIKKWVDQGDNRVDRGKLLDDFHA